MAKKKDNTLLIGLGIAAVLGGVYYFSRDTAAAPSSPGVSNPGGALPGTVSSNLNASTSIAQQQAPTTTAGTGTASSQDLVLTNWFDSLDPANKNQAYAMLPNMTTDEKNQMANIIVNVWMKQVSPTSDQVNFWNTWRVKYHIEDGTFA